MEAADKYADMRREFAWYLSPDGDYVPERLQPLAQEIFGKLADLAVQADNDNEVNVTFEGWTYTIDDGKTELADFWTAGRNIGEEIVKLKYMQDGLFEGEDLHIDDPHRFNFQLILEKEDDGGIIFGLGYTETDEHYDASNAGTYAFELAVEQDMIKSGNFNPEIDISVKEDYDWIERYTGRINFVPSEALLLKMNNLLSQPNLNVTPWGLGRATE